jgi:tight adherence protein B
LGVRYGGRADLLLERMAHFLRDREQAERELVAMSSETRMSAWVLGLMPAVVGTAIIMLNAAYFIRMWDDPSGRQMLYGALALQLTGAFLLYRLARLA